MKQNLFKGRSARTKIFTAITVAGILALFAINLLLTYFVGRNAWYLDLTPEELYSLSDEMKAECAAVDKKLDGKEQDIEIIFCADPDTLLESTVTRVTYVMALQLQREFKNIKVTNENIIYNPTAFSKYRTTSLKQINPTDVIICYGNTYRIVSAESFWTKTSEETYFSYNGEYKMASLIMSVTVLEKPTVYFTVGHGETFYDKNAPESAMSVAASGIYDLLSERGFDVRTIDISEVEKIPDDCAILIINDPKTDFDADYGKEDGSSFYYSSDTEKIDRYLRKTQGALMVARDYKSTELKNLDGFLENWGFSFKDYVVTDASNHIGGESDTDQVIAMYRKDEDSYAAGVYGEFATLMSAPPTIFKNTGFIECSFYATDIWAEAGTSGTTNLIYNSFLTSYSSAMATDTATGDTMAKDKKLDLAAVVVREEQDEEKNESKKSFVFCANSASFFDTDLLKNNSFANYDITAAIINDISRSDIYASMELGGMSLNSPKYGGKQLVYDTLSENAADVFNSDATYKETLAPFTKGAKIRILAISVAVPLIPLAIGVVIRIRRKFL